MAALFSGHAQAYQALSAQAALFHEQFVRALTAGAGSYAAAEAASAAPLEGVLDVINAPALALLGRPLIGNGANGAPGTGANGGDGGILIGNGGAGGSARPACPGATAEPLACSATAGPRRRGNVASGTAGFGGAGGPAGCSTARRAGGAAAAVRAARLVPAVVRRQARIPAKPALRALRVIPAILGRPADTVVRRSATSL